MRTAKLGRLTVGIESSFEFSRGPMPDDPNPELLDAVPRLKRKGTVQFGGLQRLVYEDGWTVDEINQVVDAFPAISYVPLTLLVSVAGGELDRRGQDGSRMADVPAMWTEAAGSPEAGLAALSDGLTLADTTERYRPR